MPDVTQMTNYDELDYHKIANFLDGDVFGIGRTDDGKTVHFGWERVAEGEVVYTAEWESKRSGDIVWYVKHWYHEDGMVEETFRHDGGELNRYNQWQMICNEYATHIGAKLLFVNSDNFGIETENGELLHIYADELMEILKGGYIL